jgi:hypothetical protein
VGAKPAKQWTTATLERKRTRGDEVADKVVAKIYRRGEVEAVNDLLRRLLDNDELVPAALPDEVEAYLARTAQLPPWADTDRIARAQDFFSNHGPDIALALICASLPSSYAAAKGVKVLVRTGQLGSYTKRRVIETGQFLMDVMEPGSFGRDGRAVRTIQRVRLMHAAIRHLVQARPDPQFGAWDDDWGLPINQEDLAGTLMAFAFVIGEPLPRAGLHVEPGIAADYLHAWAVVGHILGVDDDLIPHSLAEARALVTAIRIHQFEPSVEGRFLTSALVEFLDETIPGERLDHLGPALIRQLVGDETAAIIGLPEGTHHDDAVDDALHALFGSAHLLERHRMLHAFVPPLSRSLVKALLCIERGGQRATFAMPPQLVHPWALENDLAALRASP